MRPVLAVVLLLLPVLGGCTAVNDFVDQARRPDHPVARTEMTPGELHTHDRFQVIVQQEQPLWVEIEARGDEVLRAEGLSHNDQAVVLELHDGTWDITYWVDDHKWETLKDLRIDATAPRLDGLERVGAAQDGRYTIGSGATVEEGARVRVLDLQTGRVLADSLPYTVLGLHEDRVYAYLVAVGDDAGNWNNVTVQVRSGEAAALPEQGAHTFGVLARYTNEVRVWDISDLGAYLTPAEARGAVDPGWLGDGYQIDPHEPAVQDAVDAALDGERTTAEVAYALFEWLFDNLDYHDERLSESDLLHPSETIERGGGVCRDLAAVYVSLLRAAGVPARLVSGYLAGQVNGFHAWVEFYGGGVGGQGPWVPVDVSPIDGAFETRKAMSAFGIQRPDYLTLRNVPHDEETEGWSTALSVRYNYFGSEPHITFEKDLQSAGSDQMGVLCVNEETRARTVANREQECGQDTRQYVPDFALVTQRIIDYGILVRQANPDTKVTAEVAYPFLDSVTPNGVEFLVYGDEDVQGWQAVPERGVYRAEFTV